MEIEGKLREFVIEELQWDRGKQLDADYQLIQHGVVDSLGILSLVSFIEDEFGVQVQDEELVPEHFATISAITRLVTSKKSSVTP